MREIDSQVWGDGFIPRVNARSRQGVMQALGPSDLFTESTLSIPYVLVDTRLTMEDSELATGFRDRNVSIIVDTQAWRYSDPRTWSSKWSTFPYAPTRPFMPCRQWVHDYVIDDLSAQMKMGGRCLMLPGWFASLDHIELAADVAAWTLEAFERFRRKGFLIPAIAWLPITGGSREASLAAAKVYVESGAVQGIYAQLNKVSGLRDPLDRFKGSAKLILAVQSLGLPVIAGHLGPVGLAMRAIGVAAADCGPSESQSFNYSHSITAALPRQASRSFSAGGPLTLRTWVSELGQTVTARQMAAIRRNRIAFAEVMCRRACHRFRLGPDTVAVAVQHGILCLSDEARQQSRLPASMRVDAARRSLLAMKSRVGLVDAVLRREHQKALRQDHLDVQIALLAEANTLHGVA